jgi:hypothetical protein
MIRIVEELSGDWRRLDERIDCVTEEIEQLAHGTESCRQLMTVPSIGPIIASAMVAAIGNGASKDRRREQSLFGRPQRSRVLGCPVPRWSKDLQQRFGLSGEAIARARSSRQGRVCSRAPQIQLPVTEGTAAQAQNGWTSASLFFGDAVEEFIVQRAR